MGTWRRGQFPQHVNVRTAWPLLTPLEIDAGDFAILRSPTYSDFCDGISSTLSSEEFDIAEQEFLNLYMQCIRKLQHIPLQILETP